MSTAQELIDKAQTFVQKSETFPNSTAMWLPLESLSREDVRTIVWLIETEKYKTITEDELEEHMKQNETTRKDKI